MPNSGDNPSQSFNNQLIYLVFTDTYLSEPYEARTITFIGSIVWLYSVEDDGTCRYVANTPTA